MIRNAMNSFVQHGLIQDPESDHLLHPFHYLDGAPDNEQSNSNSNVIYLRTDRLIVMHIYFHRQARIQKLLHVITTLNQNHCMDESMPRTFHTCRAVSSYSHELMALELSETAAITDKVPAAMLASHSKRPRALAQLVAAWSKDVVALATFWV